MNARGSLHAARLQLAAFRARAERRFTLTRSDRGGAGSRAAESVLAGEDTRPFPGSEAAERARSEIS